MPLPRRRELAIFVAVAIAFGLLARLAGRTPLAPPRLPRLEGASAPVAQPFALRTLDGDERTLADFRGRVVLLNFWATWCPPCRRELPSLEALHRALGPEGLAVVGVSVDAGDPERVARFAAQYDLTFAQLHDPDETVARRYGVFAYPTSFVIDREGRLRHGAPSAWDWNHADARAWLRALLAQ